MNRVATTARRLTVAVLAGVSGCLLPVPAPAVEIPRTDLSAFDAEVQEQITAQIELIEALLAEGAQAPVLADALGTLAEIYIAYELYDLAGPLAFEAQRRQPDVPRWPYLRGYLYRLQGQLDEAVEQFDRARALTGDASPVLFRLAQLHLDLDRLEEAAALYTLLREREPDCAAAAHFGLGEVARRAGEASTAVEHFQAALELEPRAPQIRYGLGLALRELGRREEAAEMLRDLDFGRTAMGEGWGCPEPLRDHLATLATGVSAHLYRGARASLLGAAEVGLAEYRKAVEVDPADAVARQSLGSALFRAGEVEAAAEQFEAAVRLDPGDAASHFGLGTALLRLGRVDEGVELLHRAVELAPGLREAHLRLADVYEQNRLYDRAVYHYRQVTALDGSDVGVRVHLAQALIGAGSEQEGIEELGRLLDEHPPEDADELLLLATLQAMLGDEERALRHLVSVAESAPSPAIAAQAQLSIGQVRLNLGQAGEAVESFRAALELDPDLEEAARGLEWARQVAEADQASRAEGRTPPP